MGWFSGLVVYLIIWWLVIFLVLPFGARPPERVEQGHEPGAPARPMIARKMLITTLVAALLWGLVFALVESDVLSFRELSRRE